MAYPADPLELRSAVDALLPSPSARVALGLLLPHGPLHYCGAVAAAALTLGACDETAVVLAPNHAARGPRASIAADGSWAIPGAIVPVDERLAESIRGLGALHEAPEVVASESAIETLLPLLLASCPRLSLVPILLHDIGPSAAARIGGAIADAIVGRGGGASIVVTSDLVHYADPAEAEAIGAELLAHFVALDADGLEGALDGLRGRPGLGLETCGASALLTAIHALRALGSAFGIVAARATSATVAGERGRCVAYGSAVFTRAG